MVLFRAFLMSVLACLAVLTLQAEASETLVCQPVRLLPAYGAREVWRRLAANARVPVAEVVRRAEQAAEKPMPPFPRTAFLDFRKTGERWSFEAANNARWVRVFALAYGELIEGKGRFLKPLAEGMETLCESPTWVLCAHDRTLANLEGRKVEIDLASAHRAWQMAELVAAFGEALPPKTRAKTAAAVRARAIDPYLAMVRKNAFAWWANSLGNWNPVCHAGVVGAVLALPGVSAVERAETVAAAKAHVRRYLHGFTAEGWTPEGIAYWNYGFGNFAALAELVRRSTSGQEDWLLWPEARAPALTTPRLRLCGSAYPALADCAADMAADARLANFLARRLGEPDPSPFVFDGSLPFPHAFLFEVSENLGAAASLPAVTWLPQTQLAIGRAPGMAFFVVGGNNDAPHNHNDVGVFGVAVEGVGVLADLGGESYSAKTFSGARYTSELLNSFGHAVPRPDGTLQSAGRGTSARVLESAFGEEGGFRLVLDLAPAYRLSKLRKLTREVVWEPAYPALTITDRFVFSEPCTFETALVGWGTCSPAGADCFRVTFRGKALEAEVKASAAMAFSKAAIHGEPHIERPCAWMDWNLPEDGIPERAPGRAFAGLTPHRWAFALQAPAAEGFISVRLRPASSDAAP